MLDDISNFNAEEPKQYKPQTLLSLDHELDTFLKKIQQ